MYQLTFGYVFQLNEPKHVAECLIVNIYYQHVLCLLTDYDNLYYYKTQRDGFYQNSGKILLILIKSIIEFV